jgi:hypothetical protein
LHYLHTPVLSPHWDIQHQFLSPTFNTVVMPIQVAAMWQALIDSMDAILELECGIFLSTVAEPTATTFHYTQSLLFGVWTFRQQYYLKDISFVHRAHSLCDLFQAISKPTHAMWSICQSPKKPD